MNIYVGNLPYTITEDELSTLFGEFGEVISAKIIIDRMSGRSKGFGFVEMTDQTAGEAAVSALDGSEQQGRNLKVNVARPRNDAPRDNR